MVSSVGMICEIFGHIKKVYWKYNFVILAKGKQCWSYGATSWCLKPDTGVLLYLTVAPNCPHTEHWVLKPERL